MIGNDDKRRSLLGYDWIAGMLDNTSRLSERPDTYFDDLKEFRRVNKQDCTTWVILYAIFFLNNASGSIFFRSQVNIAV